MRHIFTRIGCLLSLVAIGLFFPVVSRASTDLAKCEPSVVRILIIKNVANPQDIATELPFFRRIQNYGGSTIYGFGSGFVVGEGGLVLTTAHIAMFDESNVQAILQADAGAYHTSLREAAAPADKDAIDKEYDEAMEKIPKIAKALLDRKSILQELYAIRKSKGTVEFRRSDLYDAGKIDYRRDVALLKVQGLSAPALKLSLAPVSTGEAVHVLGFPDISDPKAKDAVLEWMKNKRDVESAPSPDLLRFAEMSSVAGEVRRVVRRGLVKEALPLEVIEHGAPVTQGTSGGPLVNSAGRVIGLNVYGPYSDSGRTAVSANELDQLLKSEWSINHLTTTWGPLINERNIMIAIGAVALLGIAALVIAFRKKSGPGQNTVMNWVSGARPQSAFQQPAFFPDDPPPLPPDEPPSITVDDYTPGHSQNRSILRSGNDSRLSTKRADSTVMRSRRSYESFELTPEEKGGTIIELEGSRFAQENGRLIMGRSSDFSHVQVDDRSVSKRHAAVRIRGASLYIEDLESANGTLVNGKKLEPFRDTLLEPGDTITIGRLSFRLRSINT